MSAPLIIGLATAGAVAYYIYTKPNHPTYREPELKWESYRPPNYPIRNLPPPGWQERYTKKYR